MTYLVDTDYVADYLKGQRHVADVLEPLLPAGLAISIITVAEIYEGIYYGQNRAQHEAGFRHLLQSLHVLGITTSIAQQFARLRGHLRATPQGKALVQPKDNYDLFIAATALHYRLTLVTRNSKDYQHIPHLKLYQAS